jgi:hypothetical protein
MDTNSFNNVYDAWPVLELLSRHLLQMLRLQAVSRHRLIAFAPEGSSLDRCLKLNSRARQRSRCRVMLLTTEVLC